MVVHRHNTRVNLNFHECILLLVINALVSAEPGHRMPCVVWQGIDTSRWASGPDNWILTSVPEVYGVWNLATNYHGAYFLSFLQTSSLFQAPIQAGLAPDCVEETLYFTNIYFS